MRNRCGNETERRGKYICFEVFGMNGTAAESRERLALNIGRTKRYLQDGLSIVEIAIKLKLPESSVRRYVGMIHEAEENEKKHMQEN